ncbi:hypothetical protein WSI_03620 [Candidatus Liberibacter asiaticus str. gxpsy]|uniref:Uncharacterized protein n=2 Tax=Liberibacter asiaticus TaxID=34021 RepID=C6XG27_LIBAP|nr:hypothetical protein CLIBASIA_03760 [Candidatus Liberibacter asiaticus str. psy62]AGH17094.1 hypothetical protein WSI_03620 [Candidatus Liberibacter asiaticus str. gxpsy]BAP26616.1 hypothetical protein CGUJ_03760 [Candidatus Liberibacter asiaticus str. Ishi-1]
MIEFCTDVVNGMRGNDVEMPYKVFEDLRNYSS